MEVTRSLRRWQARRADDSLGRRLAALAVLAGVILLASVAVSAYAVVNLNNSVRRQVDTIDPAQVYAGQLESALVDEETGVRGYLLTRNKSLLAPYVLGVGEERSASARLGSDLAGESGLDADARRAERAAVTWHRRYAVPTLRAVAAGARAAAPPSRTGRRLFGRFRSSMLSFDARLAAAHSTANGSLTSADHELIALLGLCLLALLAVFEVTWILIRRWVTVPLLALAGDVRRVSSGAFTHPLAAQGSPEVRSLAHDVDTMRSRILSDLGEVEAARTALATQRAALERSNKDLEQFAYIASHDLQEPLRKMASFSELVLRRYGGEIDDRGREFLTFIAEGARRMQRLISDVLELSRVGRTSRPFETVNLNDAFLAARANLSSVIESTAALVSAKALPTVTGDISLLTALFQNLIGNSLKFRSSAVPHVVVSASLDDDGFWRIAVDDNGIGIEPQNAERVFAMFQRLHARSAYPGTGIGLALCQRIVEHHGGRIWLDTTHQPGTSIVFTLPRDAPVQRPVPSREVGVA